MELIARAATIAALWVICVAPFAAERSEEDVARDATSRPQEVLDFFGVKPGMTVIDLFAGNGYYSELLAERVGDAGKVYMHNNQAFVQFAGNVNTRLGNDRLPNVEPYIREIEDIHLPSQSVDLVLIVMTYHDAYFRSNGWTVTADPLFATIHRILKPGGTLAVVDHAALPGTGKAAAQYLHRIDPQFAKADISARGFDFVAASDVLANPADPLDISVFNPAIRRQTDRFVYKFVKSE